MMRRGVTLPTQLPARAVAKSKRPSWPASPAERRDRNTIVSMIGRIGEEMLQFTVYDLRRYSRQHPKFALERQSDLARHVAALPETFICTVGHRFGEEAGRSALYYILAHRRNEYVERGPQPDDLERVWYAVRVACMALGVTSVPTSAVTHVLSCVLDLVPSRDLQTSTQLGKLSNRNPALIASEKAEDGWARWRPIGTPPQHPSFDAWVATYKTSAGASGQDDLIGSGLATLSELVRELVVIGTTVSASKEWPVGHSVTAADIQAAAGHNARARELLGVIARRGTTLGAVLGDASKQRVAGALRVGPRLVKLDSSRTGRPYYDVPDDANFHRRRLIVLYRDAQADASHTALEGFERERGDALRATQTSVSPQARALATVRMLLLITRVQKVAAAIRSLRDEPLSAPVLRSIRDLDATVIQFLTRLPDETKMTEEAERFLTPLGFSLAAVMYVPRPVLTAEDCASWFPKSALRDRRPSEWIANAVSLRRFPNLLYVRRSSKHSRYASTYLFDRVEALSYWADWSRSRMVGFVHAGANLLGPDLRSIDLVAALCNSADRGERRAALSALALLDDTRAISVAVARLGETALATDEVAESLYTLLLAKSVDPASWPVYVREGRQLTGIVRAVVLASRQDRWLLQP